MGHRHAHEHLVKIKCRELVKKGFFLGEKIGVPFLQKPLKVYIKMVKPIFFLTFQKHLVTIL